MSMKIISEKVYGGIVTSSYSQYVITKKDLLLEFDYEQTIEQKAAIPEAFLTAYQLIKYYSNV